MVNLTALQNMTNPSFNTTILENSDNITSNIFANSNTTTEGYFGLIILLLVCFYLLYTMFREDGFFRYDFVKAALISTGISTILGITLLLGGLITSFQHVMWFGIAFVILMIATFIIKDKG